MATTEETRAQDLSNIIRYEGILGNPQEGYTGIKIFNTSSKDIIAFRGKLTSLNGTNPTIMFTWYKEKILKKTNTEIDLSPNKSYYFFFESKTTQKGLFGKEKVKTKESSILPTSILENYNDFYDFFASSLSEEEKNKNKTNPVFFEIYSSMKENPEFQAKPPIGKYTITAIMFSDGTVLEATP